MKKFLIYLMVAVMTVSLFAVPVSAEEELAVFLDGEMLEFDVQPQLINGRTMVPMRKIFEALGATVEWEDNTQKVTATKQDTIVVMQIDSRVLSVNGNNVTLDVPPQLVDGRTLVPVRAVAESFDIHVIWDESFNAVLLSNYIPFAYPIQTFNYLCDWLLENGEAFASYTHIGWEITEGIEVDVRCYPNAPNGKRAIAFFLSSYNIDGISTALFLHPTSDGTGVYAMYDSAGDTFHINGDVDMERHTKNYPISCVECEYEGSETEYGLLEDTRQRINFLLDEVDILFSFKNTGVNLKSLGFKKH